MENDRNRVASSRAGTSGKFPQFPLDATGYQSRTLVILTWKTDV